MNHELIKNKNKSDEFYTQNYAVYPIIKYIPVGSIIWCPFDKMDSAFVITLSNYGFKVIFSHIDTGQDFFTYEPPNWDIIISNPPYSLRTPILQRLYSFKKPFALLINESGLFDSKIRFELFSTNYFEIIMFNKRIHYVKNNIVSKNEPFKSIYLCSKILPIKIIFHNLELTNQNSFQKP